MTTLITEVYDALLDAGASEPKARKAAEAIAAYENRFSGIELKMERLDGRLTLIQWMLAVLIGGVGTLLVKAFVA